VSYFSQTPQEIEEEFSNSLITKNKDTISQGLYEVPLKLGLF
jgi:hypothetical protein